MRVRAVTCGVAAALALDFACSAFGTASDHGTAAPSEGGLEDGDASPALDAGGPGDGDGSARVVALVTPDTPPVTGVAATESYVYWTEGTSGVVGRMALDGGSRTIFDTPKGAPGDILVTDNAVFWSNDNQPGALYRAGLDGSGAAPFWNAGDAYPHALAITSESVVVLTEDTLFWLDRNNGTVVAQTNPALQNLDSPFGLATYAETAYWTESGSASGHVWVATTNDPKSYALAANQANPEQIAVYQDTFAWISNADESVSVAKAGVNVTATSTHTQGSPIGVAADASGVYVLVQDPDHDASASAVRMTLQRFSWSLAGPESLAFDIFYDDGARRWPHKIALTTDFAFVAGRDSLLRVSKDP
jgi:hypothetical protein